MAKKKKKEKDFQKVKLKAGRKLVKSANETKTDFKAKKLIIKEANVLAKDPVGGLMKCSFSSPQVKLICLGKINDGCLVINPRLITGDVINTLSRFLLDSDHRVRCEAIKAIKRCLNVLETKGQPIDPIINVILTYMKCAFTHIDHAIYNQAIQLFEFIVTKCSDILHEEMMELMLTRLSPTSSSTVNVQDLEMCLKLIRLVTSKQANKPAAAGPVEMEWSPDNCYIDISHLALSRPGGHFNLTFPTAMATDVTTKFYAIIEEIVAKEVNGILAMVRREDPSFTQVEARRAVAVLAIDRILSGSGGRTKTVVGDCDSINVNIIKSNHKTRKQVSFCNALHEQLNDLLKRYCHP